MVISLRDEAIAAGHTRIALLNGENEKLHAQLDVVDAEVRAATSKCTGV